ncbi:MAG: hypothetical protein ACREAY_01265 [Nitrososphaera sp.]
MQKENKSKFKQVVAKHRSQLGAALVIGLTFANAVALVAMFVAMASR